jgi:hypothetical protein
MFAAIARKLSSARGLRSTLLDTCSIPRASEHERYGKFARRFPFHCTRLSPKLADSLSSERVTGYFPDHSPQDRSHNGLQICVVDVSLKEAGICLPASVVPTIPAATSAGTADSMKAHPATQPSASVALSPCKQVFSTAGLVHNTHLGNFEPS